MLFSCEFGEISPEEVYSNYIENLDDVEAVEISGSEFVKDTFFGAYTMADECEAYISESAKGWSKNRISRTARAIIRLGMYEIEKTDLPDSIAINEAVELAKQYDEQKVAGFVNAVLGNISRGKAEPSDTDE